MKSAIECRRQADRCEELAAASKDESDRKMLLTAAAQWRSLAGDAEAHERMKATVGEGPA